MRRTVGALCLVLAGPVFLLANVVVGLGWQDPTYSWAGNNISDLGNVTCGTWDTSRPRYVCSPWHVTMNASMVATAVLLTVGIVLTWWAVGRGGAVRTAQVLALLGSAGFGLVGLYPADVDENMHVLGALLIFVVANAAAVVAGFARRDTLLGTMRRVSLGLGVSAFVGTVLFLAQVDIGIGVGGMERVPVFLPLLWMGLVGVTILRRRRAAGG
jgi:hypothetical membrane protein